MKRSTPRIILASGSPRRRELLEQIGLSFDVITSDVDETPPSGLSPSAIAELLATRKCNAVAERNRDAFVVAADTLITYRDFILGKPDSTDHAIEMLHTLSGTTHSVITGVAYSWLDQGVQSSFSVESRVTFHELSEELIARYVATGDPLDKAGAYGIQGLGALLVKHVEGSYWNVVGLPLSEVVDVLRRELGDAIFIANET